MLTCWILVSPSVFTPQPACPDVTYHFDHGPACVQYVSVFVLKLFLSDTLWASPNTSQHFNLMLCCGMSQVCVYVSDFVVLFLLEHSGQLRNVITVGVVQLMSLDDSESPAAFGHTAHTHRDYIIFCNSRWWDIWGCLGGSPLTYSIIC